MARKSQTTIDIGGKDLAPTMSTQIERIISKGDIVEIEVIKAHDGLEVGYTKRVQRYSSVTIYMLEQEYWKVK